MKKLLIVLFALGLLVGCSSATKSDKESYVIGLDDTFAPMGFKDDKGNYTGFDIELAKAVGEYLGIDFTFKSIDWNSNVLELNSKKIDLVWNGMTITDERLAKMSISDPYFEDSQALYVLKDSSIKAKDDLVGKTVGLQLGSSAEEAFGKDAVASTVKEVKKYQDNTQALTDLKAGRVDAVVVDSVVGDYYLSKQSGFLKLEDNFGIEFFGVGARTEDKELTTKINEAIKALKDNGTYQEIFDRWFKNNG